LVLRNLLIPLNGKNAQIVPSADLGYTAGTQTPELFRSRQPPKDPLPEIDPRFLPKFAAGLPDHLLAQFARERLYDWNAATGLSDQQSFTSQ
jgi:hypothetical protein